MANIILLSVLIALQFIVVTNAGKCPTVDPIPDFNVDKYLGVWYEIKRLPARFENGKKCIQADYDMKKIDDSQISVNNSAVDISSGKSSFKLGKATFTDPAAKNKLTVQFKVGPWDLINVKGQYNVAETDYVSYAIIYTCKDYFFFKKEYAWILSRTRTLEETKTNSLVNKLKKYTNTDALVAADQTNC